MLVNVFVCWGCVRALKSTRRVTLVHYRVSPQEALAAEERLLAGGITLAEATRRVISGEETTSVFFYPELTPVVE
jgi:hypothetical protein